MQSDQNLPEDHCIFIRGYRATRLLRIIPRLRGAAEPTQDPNEDEPEPDIHLIPTPANFKVMLCILHFKLCLKRLRILLMRSWSMLLWWAIQVLVVSAVLFSEVVQQAPGCDMVLVHDDDLMCIEVSVCNIFR